MKNEIVGKDKNGILRCYGIGETRQQALKQCLVAAKVYLADRKDIESLFLFDGNTEKPIIDPAQWSTWEVKR